MQTRAGIVVVLALALGSGCGGSGAPGLTWIADGTGVANDGPLMPLASGTRASGYMLENVVAGDDGATLRGDTALYREGAEGVFLVGAPYPQLIVPRTVRVGMKWQTRASADAHTVTHLVSRRAVTETLAGTRPVWTIETYFADLDAGVPTALGSWDYIEGVGPANGDVTVALEQAAGHDETEVPGVALTPVLTVAGGPPLALGDFRMTGLQVVDPGAGAPRTVVMHGMRLSLAGGEYAEVERDHCMRWDGASLTEAASVAASGEFFHLGPTCPSYSADAASDGGLWATEDTVLVSADGVLWLPVMATGSPLVYGSIWTAYLGGDGLPRLLSTDGSPGGMRIVLQQLVAPPGTSQLAVDPIGGWVAGSLPPRWPPFMIPGPGLSADQPSFIVLDDQGRVLHTVLQGDDLPVPRVVGAAVGARSLGVDADGEHLFVTTLDGMVDRIVSDAAGVRRERLARLDVPADQVAVGVVADGDRLLVFTHEASTVEPGYLGYDDGTVYAWTAPLLASPVPEPLAPALGVRADWANSDVRICWPPTDEPLDAATWTIDDVAPAAVIPDPDRSCATLARDTDALASGLSNLFDVPPLGWNRAQGRVPGLGEMLFADSLALSYSAVDGGANYWAFAPLAAGGAAGEDTVLVPGLLSALHVRGGSAERVTIGVDGRGAGLWQAGCHIADAGDEQFVDLVAGSIPLEIPLQTIPHVNGGTMPWAQGLGEQGGMIVSGNPSPLWFVDAGGATPIPDGPRTALVEFRRANGELCGQDGTAHFCMALDGSGERVTDRVFLDIPVNSYVSMHGWAPLGDGTYLVADPGAAGGQHLGRLDADTWTITPYPSAADPAKGVLFVRPGPDGKLWAVLSYDDGRQVAGRADPGGFQPIDGLPGKLVGPVAFGPMTPMQVFPFHEVVLVYGFDPGDHAVWYRYFPAG